MAEDQDRAARIGQLKDDNPRLTWREIADRVGVTERAAAQWRRTGALKPENAEALAEVFDVDFEFIWKGHRPDTPEPFPVIEAAAAEQVEDVAVEFRQRVDQTHSQLDRIEKRVNEARAEQDRISALIEKQNELLARQSDVLERIEAATAANDTSTQRLAEASNLALQRLQELESAGESQAAAQPANAGSDSPPASN